ncbi:hypothetical protein DPMN_150015 [Dreissena polymorpha]|uniref:Uncharacterized protein n=1 Tax=Dreissena polymorpha TaxID=45954 RepID=A0A9D4J5W2_DREPO|nr:hypothetical protein DPMN_150015 [Dreissena polymorpha]
MICCVCLGEHSEKPNEIYSVNIACRVSKRDIFCEYCLQVNIACRSSVNIAYRSSVNIACRSSVNIAFKSKLTRLSSVNIACRSVSIACRDTTSNATMTPGSVDSPGGAMKTGKWVVKRLELPYDLQALSWDSQHKNNLEESYCYCGSPGM